MAEIMRNWADVLPFDVARAQHGYERRRAAVHMRELGMTYREVGEKLGVGKERAREMVGKQIKEYGTGKRSPIELYLDRGRRERIASAEWLRS